MDQLLAWRRGEVVFADISLPEAVTEMNRYSATPIVLAAGLSDLRVSGQYKTGDSEGFARAVSAHRFWLPTGSFARKSRHSATHRRGREADVQPCG